MAAEPRSVTGVPEEANFPFQLNLNSYMWLMANIQDSTGLDSSTGANCAQDPR